MQASGLAQLSELARLFARVQLFGLARLMTDHRQFEAARDLWTSYLGLEPPPKRAGLATKYATLCRLELASK